MTTISPTPPFPCPFCQSAHVELVGGGLVFLHYQCGECAEVWTAMAAPRPAILHTRRARVQDSRTPRVPWIDDDGEQTATVGSRTADGGRPTADGGTWLPRKQKFWRN